MEKLVDWRKSVSNGGIKNFFLTKKYLCGPHLSPNLTKSFGKVSRNLWLLRDNAFNRRKRICHERSIKSSHGQMKLADE